jgi:diguanylate cyclase (GGDEF)-like protein
VSLSCVYVDVNGLHELNNASGHEKGDQMLQTVALELQGRFGRDNCYRTGGDEFVAFVQDEPETAVRAAIDELIRALERKGCSAAIGVVTQNAGSVDLDTLIRQAEQQMYQAKEEHYRIQRQLEH